jgi:hypothetical protein
MNYKNGFLCLSLFFMLLGCHRVVDTQTFEPPYSCTGKICIQECLERRTHCQQMCDTAIDQCKVKADENAYYRYIDYSAIEKASHKDDSKYITDFSDANCCNKLPCHCARNFEICYRDCGGKIIKGKKLV